MPFDPKKVEKASSVEKQLSSYKAPCRGCSKKVKHGPAQQLGMGCFWTGCKAVIRGAPPQAVLVAFCLPLTVGISL